MKEKDFALSTILYFYYIGNEESYIDETQFHKENGCKQILLSVNLVEIYQKKLILLVWDQ